MNENNLQHENSKQEEKSNILTLILGSILLHLLIILAIIFYRFEYEKTYEIPRITSNDQAVLWTNPPANIPQQMPVQPKLEPKKEEPKIPEPNVKLPKIMPGQQGIDEQKFDGDNSLIQEKKQVEHKKPIEPKKIEQPKKEEPKPKLDIPTDSGKKILQPTTDIIRQDPTSQKISAPFKDIPPSQDQNRSTESPESKKEIVFDTNLDFLGKKTVQEKLIEKNELYENVPSQETKKIKTISYKDIGLGSNNTSVNIGNSAHLMIQGTSPDIPQGDELKYITYLNQMANMIVSSMRSNSHLHLLPRTRGETVICFMKVTREGQLLDVRIVRPSNHEIINIFIVESIRQVGLFNQLPKFISKDTFEINWHILT